MENVGDVQRMLLDQVRAIAAEVKPIPQLQAKIDTLDKSTREMVVELRARDESQARAIEDMRLRLSETLAALAGVSSTLSDQKSDLRDQGQRLQKAEEQIKATFDAQLETSRRLRDIAMKVDALSAKMDTLIDPATLQKLAEEVDTNRPWMNGIKWFLRILFGLLATAAAVGLLLLLANGIGNTLGG